MSNAIVLLLGFLLAPAASAATPLKQAVSPRNVDLKFEYGSFEGDWKYSCKSTLAYENSPYDYKVRCYDGPHVVRTFDVHLALSVYHVTAPDRTSIEVLYWVNGDGATSWMHLDGSSKMNRFQSSQSIRGEAAALRLEIDLRERFKRGKVRR